MLELTVFVISLIALVLGADWLGNSATHIAQRFSLPRVLIGATIVSLATTLPEIIIAAFSGAEGSPEIGVGTVFGSPLVNIGLTFGLLLMFSKTQVDKQYLSRTIIFFLISLSLVLILFLGGTTSPIFGLLLIIFGVIYLMIQSAISKQEESLLEEIENRFDRLKIFFTERENYHQIFYLILGSLLLFLGAHFLVNSAVVLAEILGAPQLVVGFVIIAFGTSLPEAFTTINSIIKRRVGLSTGNLFGASVLDLTLALGIISCFGGVKINPFNLYVTIGSLALLASVSLLSTYGRVSPKILGTVLVVIYLASIIWFGRIGI
ncbi:MAG TPA: sodium:calcium antiporter [Candidatus Nanoarchaeia archaeon]